MKNHGTDRIVPDAISIGQLATVLGFVGVVMARLLTTFIFKISADERKALLLLKKEFEALIESAVSGALDRLLKDRCALQRTYWQLFYQRRFKGLKADLSKVLIPEKPMDGNEWRLIFIPAGLTIEMATEAFRFIHSKDRSQWTFPGYCILGRMTHTRSSQQSYAIWVHCGQTADEEFLGQSFLQADPDMTIGETLLERLVHGIVHFAETKEPLDLDGGTICSGSKCESGLIPFVMACAASKEVMLNKHSAQEAESTEGIRRVVALPRE